MTRTALMVAAMVVLTPAANTQEQGWILVAGTGRSSCATWTHFNNADVSNWVLGFWSGLNVALNSQAGHATDGPGIVGEVKKKCTDEPSISILDAVTRAHSHLSEQGR